MNKIIFAFSFLIAFVACKKEEKKEVAPTPVQATTPNTVVTYSVKYNGNGKTFGNVPIDGTSYHTGDTATILLPGNIQKTGFTFYGWKLDSIGNGITYEPTDKIIISDTSIKLYAWWLSNSINPASNNTNLNCGGSGWSSPSCASSSSLTLKGTNGKVEVTMTFFAIPATGSYSVSSISGPSNVKVEILNAPGQPWGVKWFGKIGTVNVNTTSNSINATFSGISCTQSNYIFPVVTLNGNLGCN